MDVRTVLAMAGGDGASLSAIHCAGAVAEAFGAALVGVGAATLEEVVEAATRFMDDETLASLRLEEKAALVRSEARFRAALAGRRVEAGWRGLMAEPLDAVVRFAAGADLIVADRDHHGSGLDPAPLVMAAGAPVLLAPPGDAPFEGRTVLVAWKNTREARRALGDALPFLRRAASVMLASVQEDESPADDGLDDALARLSRHGISAKGERFGPDPDDTGDALLAIAEHAGADLIVAGAYGHSRVREWVFGGVTRTLLRRARTFVLLSR
jgi:nucleotide-binding universal stress UspA family protein